jgi:hypothetical protein
VCRDGAVRWCVVGDGYGGLANVGCVSSRVRCGDGGVVDLRGLVDVVVIR